MFHESEGKFLLLLWQHSVFLQSINRFNISKMENAPSSISDKGEGYDKARWGIGGVWTPLHSELPELTKDCTLISDSTELFCAKRGLIWPIKAVNDISQLNN